MTKFDKLFHQVEDLFTRRWNALIVGTLVESIHDNIDRQLSRNREHILEHTANELSVSVLDPFL